MGNCSGVKSRVSGNGAFLVKDAKFGKVKKSIDETFTCFLAAAEQFVAMKKNEGVKVKGKADILTAGNPEHANLRKYLDRVCKYFYDENLRDGESSSTVDTMIRAGARHHQAFASLIQDIN